MIERIRQELELQNLITRLKERLKVEERDQLFLEQIREQPIRHCLVVHRLHAIAMSYDQYPELSSELLKLNLLQKLIQFLRDSQSGRLSEDNEITDYDLFSIIELAQFLLQIPKNNEEKIRIDVEATKNILGTIYPKIEHSGNQELLGTFVRCVFVLRKFKRDVLQDYRFAELFIKTLSKSDEFLLFFCDYVSTTPNHQYQTMELLITGLALRLPNLIIDDNYRLLLLDAYTSLLVFLQRQPADSIWFGVLLRPQNIIIFDVFKAMMTKNWHLKALAMLMNQFVRLYLGAKLSEYRKYEFILSFYQFILTKAPTFFTFVSTDIFNEERPFLRWFVSEKLNNSEEVVLTYMNNRFALEFLLIMMIYYLFHHPEKAPELAAKMRNLGLLQEAKCFIEYDSLQEYLRVFYMHAEQQQQYEQFLNSIQDATISQQFK